MNSALSNGLYRLLPLYTVIFFLIQIPLFFVTSITIFFSFKSHASEADVTTINHVSKPHMMQFLPEHCEFQGQFEQTKQLHAIPSPLISSGQFYFHCEYGLIWITERPFAEAVIYTVAGAHWRVQPPEKRDPLNSKASHGMADFLLSLLGADVDALLNHFQISAKPSVHNTPDGEIEITLTPRKRWVKKALNAITLRRNIAKFSQKSQPILALAIEDHQHQNTTIHIDNMTNSDQWVANGVEQQESENTLMTCRKRFMSLWQKELCADLIVLPNQSKPAFQSRHDSFYDD